MLRRNIVIKCRHNKLNSQPSFVTTNKLVRSILASREMRKIHIQQVELLSKLLHIFHCSIMRSCITEAHDSKYVDKIWGVSCSFFPFFFRTYFTHRHSEHGNERTYVPQFQVPNNFTFSADITLYKRQ